MVSTSSEPTLSDKTVSQRFFTRLKCQVIPLTPLKLHNIVCAVIIVLSGALLVVGLLNWIPFTPEQLDLWIEVHSQILNAIFTYLLLLFEFSPRVRGLYWLLRYKCRRTRILDTHPTVPTVSAAAMTKLLAVFPFACNTYGDIHLRFFWFIFAGWMHIAAQFTMAGLMWGIDPKRRPMGGVLGCLVGSWIFGGIAGVLKIQMETANAEKNGAGGSAKFKITSSGDVNDLAIDLKVWS